MLEDGDRLLDLVGVVLVLAVVAALGVVALNLGSPPAGEGAPAANWTVERVNETHVRVVHAGGDPVRTADLRVTVDGLERDAAWTDPVTESERAVVAASEGTVVRVVWAGGRGDREVMHRERV